MGPLIRGAVLLLLVAGEAAAETSVGSAFLNMPLSVRQMGMGNVSLGGADFMRAWSNPALLAELPGRGEIALSGGMLFGETDVLGLGGAIMASRNWNLGVMLGFAGMSFEEVDGAGYAIGGEIERSSLAVGAAAAYRSNGWFRGGILLKGTNDRVMDDEEGGFASDIGVGAEFERLFIGGAVRNLGGTIRRIEYGDFTDEFWLDTAEFREELPGEVRVGAAYRDVSSRLTGAVEYVKPNAMEGSLGLGAEWWTGRSFALRVGAFNLQTEHARQFTFGLTALLSQVGLDIAVATHTLGVSSRACVSYAAPLKQGEKRVQPRPRKLKAQTRPAPVDDEKRLNTAVADLEAQNVSAGDAAVIADMLRNELVRTGVYNIVEKKNMDKILAEQAFQQTGCTDEECAVKLGKLLNVQRIVVGSFGRLLDKYFISVRVINVETGKIDFGESAKGGTVEEIESGVRDLAVRIAEQVR